MNIIETLEREEMARLNKTIPAFSPGDTVVVNVSVVEGERKRVQLVALAGERRVYGGNGWINGPLDEAGKQQALGKLG